ncbi:hypothetical protein IB221_05020 [Pantoea sp. PNT01]|uniref:hypothetical protein n=1 Tax=Pantoea TaxID=53335 RepID=UPI000D784F9D|nr:MULTISPECIES: hypothetical protein [Pantoea]AWP32597.1 hypothetical protein B9D02_08335 [Pantoea vagans]MBD9551624.1 hypothetical protein [Pantoea sp. PNT01]
MFKINFKKNSIYLSLIIFSLLISYILTSRYFPIEPDAANSSLVWRAFVTEGFSAFKNWQPTPDNWYFTTYPFNFLFFFLLNHDGKLPLILSTSSFIGLTAIYLTYIAYAISKSRSSLLTLLSLVLLPSYVYTFGFAAHPFSHYSTNFFGVVAFSLAFINLKRKSLILTLTYSVISIFSSVSDPWFLATYFLPLLLTHAYFSFKKEISFKITLILAIGFYISMSHMVQRLFKLPIQRFKIVHFDQWRDNAGWAIEVLGKSLNLFFVNNTFTILASVIIWLLVWLYSLRICISKSSPATFVSIFSFLSVAGIISSFIISYDLPADISARFFVNVICFVVVPVTLGYSFSRNPLVLLIFIIYIASSTYSYSVNKTPLYDQEGNTKSFIAFLNKNNLYFGYGDYWKYSNSVNWLSSGSLHISPVIFDETDYHIKFDSIRVQTMKSWLTEKYIKASPNRQFVAIPGLESDDSGKIRLEAIKKQLGEPDEKLTFQDMTIFVYNHKIPLK